MRASSPPTPWRHLGVVRRGGAHVPVNEMALLFTPDLWLAGDRDKPRCGDDDAVPR
jgi:hypothetical protein